MERLNERGAHPSFLLPLDLIDRAEITALAEKGLQEGQFLVDIHIGPMNDIRLELDHEERPISIEECVQLSRQVEHKLDRDEEDFSLEVTSPGLDKPFRVFRQYVKNIGRPVKVKTEDGRAHEGTLVEADEHKVVLERREKQRIEGRKAKEWVTKQSIIEMDDIVETKIEIVF